MAGVPPFQIREGNAGRILPSGAAGNVPTSLGPGQGWQSAPQAGGGGSVTPLALVYNVDSSGTATAANGAFSGDKAYKGATAVQTAVTAAIAVGDAVCIVSKCTAENVSFAATPAAAIKLGVRSYQSQRVDGNALAVAPAPALGACTSDMGAAPAAGSRLDLEGFTFTSFAANGAGAYALNFSQCFVSGNLTGTGAQHPVLNRSTVAGTATIGQLDLYDSRVTGAVTLTAGGSSIWRNTTVGGAVTADQLDAFNCTVNGLFGGGVTAGACKFRKSKLTVGVSSTCSLDAETEYASLKSGAHFDDVVFALSLSQGGNAQPVTGTVSLDFSGPTRALICPTTLAGNIVLTLNEASGSLQQVFRVDCWNTTANTVTVKDSAAATLATLPQQAAGTGTRYTFGINAITGKVVFLTSEKL